MSKTPDPFSLDALDDETHEAALRASIFGMSVWDEGLKALGVAVPEKAIQRLLAAGLFVETKSARFCEYKPMSSPE